MPVRRVLLSAVGSIRAGGFLLKWPFAMRAPVAGLRRSHAFVEPTGATLKLKTNHNRTAGSEQRTMTMQKFKMILDIESYVSTTEHQRYQSMERYVPPVVPAIMRSGQRVDTDPLVTPRWPFREIVTVVVMKCIVEDNQSLVPVEINTFSRPDFDEKGIIEAVFGCLGSTPAADTELVTYNGRIHDVPLLMTRAMKHELALPSGWAWMAGQSRGPAPHVDLLQSFTGGSRMTLAHMAEFAAVFGIPCKITAAPNSVARFVEAGNFTAIQEMCEVDVISLSLLYCNWKKLVEGGCDVWIAHERIYREVERLRAGRSYIPVLSAERRALCDRHLRGRADEDCDSPATASAVG